MELGLPLERPACDAVGTNHRVLLLRRSHRLIAPFGHRCRRLKLDREPHVWNHLRVAATGNTILIVPQSNQWPGAVAVHTDRMRVDRSVETRRLCLRARCAENR